MMEIPYLHPEMILPFVSSCLKENNHKIRKCLKQILSKVSGNPRKHAKHVYNVKNLALGPSWFGRQKS